MDNIDSVVTEGNRVLRCTQDDTPLERQVWEACLKDCLDAIEQLKKTLALRMITCDSLQKRVAELEAQLYFASLPKAELESTRWDNEPRKETISRKDGE